jgi:hypothetical protein
MNTEWGMSHPSGFSSQLLHLSLSATQHVSINTMAGAKKGKTAAKADSSQAAGGNGKGKGKGKGKQDSTQAAKAAPAKSKGAQKIDVCHILCEKFSQREEAHDKIKSGELTWSGACEKYSIEKARSGLQSIFHDIRYRF